MPNLSPYNRKGKKINKRRRNLKNKLKDILQKKKSSADNINENGNANMDISKNVNINEYEMKEGRIEVLYNGKVYRTNELCKDKIFMKLGADHLNSKIIDLETGYQVTKSDNIDEINYVEVREPDYIFVSFYNSNKKLDLDYSIIIDRKCSVNNLLYQYFTENDIHKKFQNCYKFEFNGDILNHHPKKKLIEVGMKKIQIFEVTIFFAPLTMEDITNVKTKVKSKKNLEIEVFLQYKDSKKKCLFRKNMVLFETILEFYRSFTYYDSCEKLKCQVFDDKNNYISTFDIYSGEIKTFIDLKIESNYKIVFS
jgi:hypothetical protein